MTTKSVFTPDMVCEILDANVSDKELAKKFGVTSKVIRTKRYHLASRQRIVTSEEFRDYIAKHPKCANMHSKSPEEMINNATIVAIKKKDDKPMIKEKGGESLLKIMDKILDDFANFEAEYKRETIRNNEVTLLEKLLDKNVVLLSRLIQRDLAFFSAVSEKGAKEAQDDYLTKLGFDKSDIDFYRTHRLDFETQEGNDSEV